MAIDQGTETVLLVKEERTWRVNIETAKGADPVVTVFRERIMSAADGSVVSKDMAPTAERALSGIADHTVTVPGTDIVLTMAQVAAAIAATADLWRTEDIKTSSEAA